MASTNSDRPALVVTGGRVASIDVFRGLTLLTMIFVNDVGGKAGVPAWMKHAPVGANAMTFVDVVFPAFLFIAGMSIPFALGRRIAKGESLLRLAGHVLKRTAGLLIVGVYMVNTYRFDKQAMPISTHLWSLLMFFGVILVWNQYPRSADARRILYGVLRLAGVALLLWLAWIYRGKEGDTTTWMRTSWWGIVGLIGWAYCIASLAYLLFRRQPVALMGVLALLVLVNVGDRKGALDWLGVLREYLNPAIQIGGHGSLTLAGLLAGMLFLEDSPCRSPSRRILWILLGAAALGAAGFLLRPLYGISKNGATPTWCLYCAAIGCVLYALLYVLVDLLGGEKWFRFVAPAGANPLLAYILPSIYIAAVNVFGVTFPSRYPNANLVGIGRSIVFSFVIVGVTALLARLHVRLRL